MLLLSTFRACGEGHVLDVKDTIVFQLLADFGLAH